jgi:diguanylate cyclase (GGDEF)-like protein
VTIPATQTLSAANTRVLLIEDDPQYAGLIQNILEKKVGSSLSLTHADRLSTGLECLGEGGVDVVLLDLTLPDSWGLDTLRKTNAHAPEVPIVMLTAQDDETLAIKALQEGAQDYLVKGQNETSLLGRSILYAIERKRGQEALRASEARFREVIEKNADAIIIVDLEGIVRFANRAAGSLFDVETEKLLGTMFGFPLTGEERTEIELVGCSGGPVVAEMRAVKLEWRGDIVHLASLRDITERKRMEEALKAASQDLKHTVEELEKSRKVVENQNRVLNELSIKDGLTGLYNHRHMDNVFGREFARAGRYGTDLSCLLIDLDFFKTVNDTYGHDFGDLVLKEFSVCLQDITRSSDFCFRYGGEEFLVLIPHTDIDGAKSLAEKMRGFCEEKTYHDGLYCITVTVSIGVASFRCHQPALPKHLLEFADKALYQAKAEGRNRVKVYPKESSGAHLDGKAHSGKDIRSLKDQLSAILEKTKKASVASLELLVRDMGGSKFQHHNQKVVRYINFVGDKLRLPPTIIGTFKRVDG